LLTLQNIKLVVMLAVAFAVAAEPSDRLEAKLKPMCLGKDPISDDIMDLRELAYSVAKPDWTGTAVSA